MAKEFHYTDSPQFCVIAPTNYIEAYCIDEPYFRSTPTTHLILAHIVDTDDRYAAIYKKASDEGHRIIMDNGAFELGESYAPEKLIELGHKCGADAIVLPDYPLQHWTVTLEAARKHIPGIKDAGFKTMYVPQSETGDLEGFIRGYEWAVGNPDIDIIGMSILALPNAVPHIPAAYGRVVVTEILFDRDIFGKKYHHYLGLNSGPALEIPPLLKRGALQSCDSSNPVWMAILGHEYTYNSDSYLSVSKVKAHVEFDYPWIKDPATHRRIKQNIKMTDELF